MNERQSVSNRKLRHTANYIHSRTLFACKGFDNESLGILRKVGIATDVRSA